MPLYPQDMPIGRERRWVALVWLVLGVVSLLTAAAFSALAWRGMVPVSFACMALVSSAIWIAYGAMEPKIWLSLGIACLLFQSLAGTFTTAGVYWAFILAVTLWKALRRPAARASEHDASVPPA